MEGSQLLRYWHLELDHSSLCAGGSLHIVRCLGAPLTFTSIVTSIYVFKRCQMSPGRENHRELRSTCLRACSWIPWLWSWWWVNLLQASICFGLFRVPGLSGPLNLISMPPLISFSLPEIQDFFQAALCRLQFSCCMPGFNEKPFTFSPWVWFESNFLDDAKKISVWISQRVFISKS